MTVVAYEYMGEVRYREMNLPAPKRDPDDYSPLEQAARRRIVELGLAAEDERVKIVDLLRYAEDQALNLLDMEGYPDPDPDDTWEDEDERYHDRQYGYL